jgi:VanZ family protein
MDSGLEYDFLLRKLAHMAEYAVLFRLTRRAKGSARWAAVFSLIYAVSDEWHQTFVPGREGCARDVAVDAAGVALAWALTKRGGPARM